MTAAKRKFLPATWLVGLV